jgi:hypothetical protein
MVGCYLMLRCISFATRTGEMHKGIVVRILSLIVLLVTLFLVIDLVLRRVETTPELGQIGDVHNIIS